VNFANLPIPADETPETVRAESLRMLGELAQVGMAISRSLQELAALRQKAREAAGELGSDPPDTAEQRLGPGSPLRYGRDDGMDAETLVAANDGGEGRPP
jgi:hypothetical protein